MGMENLGDYLEKHNPFAVKDEKNRIQHYNTYENAYLFVLQDLRKYCKRGYVDLVLYVKHLCGFDDDTCIEIAQLICKYQKLNDCITKEQVVMINWENVRFEREKLSRLIKGLHVITETEFDWLSFEMAWLDFKDWLEKYEKTQKETLQGTED